MRPGEGEERRWLSDHMMLPSAESSLTYELLLDNCALDGSAGAF
jgi:hypothetical protein